MRGAGLALVAAASLAASLAGSVARAQDGSGPDEEAGAPDVAPVASSAVPAGFNADRPGLSPSLAVAPIGRLIAEMGIGAVFDEGVTSLAAPTTVLRTGATDWLELRLVIPDVEWDVVHGGPDDVGLTDVAGGFKLAGPVADGLAVAFVGNVSAPTGTDGRRASGPLFDANLSLGWSPLDELGLFASAVLLTVELPTDEGERARVLAGTFSLAVGVDFGAGVGAFLQAYVLKNERSPWRPVASGGLMWALSGRVQLDAQVDVALTDQGPPPSVALGLTALF